MGQAIIVFDATATGTVTYWNRSAENLYGYSASEALGQNILDLTVIREAREDAMHILCKNVSGGNWTGTFPVKTKQGNRKFVHISNTPLYDDNGSIVGIICTSVDARDFLQMDQTQPVSSSKVGSTFTHSTSKPDHNDCQQPLQVLVTSCGARTLITRDIPFRVVPVEKLPGRKVARYGGNSEGEIGTSAAVACISKKNISWPWKVSQRDGLVERTRHRIFACMSNEQENDFVRPKSSVSNGKPKLQVLGSNNQFANDANDSNATAKISVSRTSNSISSPLCKFDTGTDSSDYDILWEELRVGGKLGQGSCGTVYHGMWYGSEIALKVFFKFEYSDDLLHSFRQEVLLMKKLRHPNVLLFMGAVCSPQHLCIVTEFMPRGSLFQLLHHSTCKIGRKRRVLMALDIARGMSYLHHLNPAIVHCDLKSSNLLVNKNWTVKVGDFGLSRLKHATYLSMKSGKGTPQWMAPEVIRNEPSDEKSDVYSFGVVLWELATGKIPWDTLNSFQVIGAVGFMDRRLEIPEDTDPHWASLIERCWKSDPRCRPTFKELLGKLKTLQKRYSVQKATSKTCSARVSNDVPQYKHDEEEVE
ncbi:probable serine/threonine-protein kinase SIS8 [Papaver somniferum]|uniref:probable serine/threonine-protein kinase SIS8 n=1 Tax=Papaver somniferum TaxID=3469 RepID=UPI000E6F727B|nr:probable serine/threonine-protein kinase SIS8 [Papaver somniferum]